MHRLTLFASSILLFGILGPVQAAPILFNPPPGLDGDAASPGFSPNSGNPTATLLTVSPAEIRGAFEFNLQSDISATGGLPDPIDRLTIDAATLTFTGNDLLPSSTLELHGFQGDGSLTSGDFATTTPIATGTIGAALNSSVSFDVTSHVQSVVNADNQFAGFMLRLQTDPGIVSINFADHLTQNLRPLLSVEAQPPEIPEPGTVALFGVGLAALGIQSWRRRRRARRAVD